MRNFYAADFNALRIAACIIAVGPSIAWVAAFE
jgi:hypothetical protein